MSPPEWSRPGKGQIQVCVPPPLAPSRHHPQARVEGIPLTLLCGGEVGRDRASAPRPSGTVSSKPETKSHQAGRQLCGAGIAVALEWNPPATGRLGGHEQCSPRTPAQASPSQGCFTEKDRLA